MNVVVTATRLLLFGAVLLPAGNAWAAQPVAASAGATPGDADGADTTETGPRVALLIGNGNYGSEAVDLDSPPIDVNAIEQEMLRLGFEVIRVDDASRSEMIDAFKAARRAAAAGVIFFYYSGHAISLEGQNYLIPVGAEIREQDDVGLEAISVEQILSMFRAARLRVLVLDACRNNPFSLGAKGASGVGLARDQLADLSGTLVAYAAAPGTTAYDGLPGEVSPFTRALLRHIRTPGLSLPHLFINVRTELRKLTEDGARGPQRSEEVSTLETSELFAFAGTVKPPPQPEGAPALARAEGDKGIVPGFRTKRREQRRESASENQESKKTKPNDGATPTDPIEHDQPDAPYSWLVVAMPLAALPAVALGLAVGAGTFGYGVLPILEGQALAAKPNPTPADNQTQDMLRSEFLGGGYLWLVIGTGVVVVSGLVGLLVAGAAGGLAGYRIVAAE